MDLTDDENVCDGVYVHYLSTDAFYLNDISVYLHYGSEYGDYCALLCVYIYKKDLDKILGFSSDLGLYSKHVEDEDDESD